jgi:hypothetical protein
LPSTRQTTHGKGCLCRHLNAVCGTPKPLHRPSLRRWLEVEDDGWRLKKTSGRRLKKTSVVCSLAALACQLRKLLSRTRAEQKIVI